MQKDKQFYDDFFNQYPVDVHNNPERFRAVSKLLSGRVLDVACGTGSLSDYFNGEYLGVDHSSVAIEKAKETRRKYASFLVADFAKDAFVWHKQFDCAYLGEFLEHIEDDKIVFSNLFDLIVPGGKIVISVPNADRVPDESHCREFTVPQIRRDYSKYGKITFHNWSGFKDRLLFSIQLGVPQTNEISLVMICKDEGIGIENAIVSVLPYVDNVVVSIDSKTTDNTEEIARLYADEVKMHIWTDNFSAVRNEAQKDVKSKWILFLDGHEFIESVGKLDEALMFDVDGILTTIKMENGLTFMYPRLFRSHLQFENAVHNAIDCKTTQPLPEFVIVHDRNNAQSIESIKFREEQRDRMIPQLMQKKLDENPKDQRALFNLANWHMTKNHLKEAIHFYKRCIKVTPNSDEKYFLQAQVGISHQLLGNDLRATWAFFDLEKICPDRWETKRLIGGIYMQREQFEKAVDYLVYALEPNKQKYLYNIFEHSLVELWDCIGMCFNALDNPAEAAIAWEQAEEHSTDDRQKSFFATKVRFARMRLLPSEEEPAIAEQQL